jgi:hypothetical protein
MANVFAIRIPRVVAGNSGMDANSSARFCTPQSPHVRPERRGVLTTEKTTRSSREPSHELSSSARHARSVVAHPGPQDDGAVARSAVAHPRDGQRWIWRKIAEYRKAVVTCIGSFAAVVLAVKDPLASLLPSFATHWMGYAVAAATAFATYRATNAKPEKLAKPEAAAGAESDELPASSSQPQLGWALASMACVLGGAIFAGRLRGRRAQPIVAYTVLLPHGGSSAGP